MKSSKKGEPKKKVKQAAKSSKNHDDLRRIEQTEDISELLELTRSEDAFVRLKAAQ